MSADIPGININAGASILCQPPDGPVRFTDITDGSSSTILVVEDAGRPTWYGSRGLVTTAGSYQAGPNGPAPQGGGAGPTRSTTSPPTGPTRAGPASPPEATSSAYPRRRGRAR